MGICIICGKHIWPWQKKVQGTDKLYSAHKSCKPEGFTGEWKREWESKGSE